MCCPGGVHFDHRHPRHIQGLLSLNLVAIACLYPEGSQAHETRQQNDSGRCRRGDWEAHVPGPERSAQPGSGAQTPISQIGRRECESAVWERCSGLRRSSNHIADIEGAPHKSPAFGTCREVREELNGLHVAQRFVHIDADPRLKVITFHWFSLSIHPAGSARVSAFLALNNLDFTALSVVPVTAAISAYDRPSYSFNTITSR